MTKKSNCLICGEKVSANEYVELPFLNNFQKFISRHLEDVCKEHKIQLLYYCKECQKKLCSDCIMLSDKHKTHKIEKYEKIYDEKIKNLNKDINYLTHQSDQYKTLSAIIENTILSVQDFIDRKVKEIETLSKMLIKDVEKKGKDINKRLLSCQTQIKEKIDLIYKTIKSISESEVSLAEEGIQKENFEIPSKTVDSIMKLNVNYELSKEITPQYEEFGTLYVKDVRKEKDPTLSPKLSLYGIDFYLKAISNNNGFLSLYIDIPNGSIIDSIKAVKFSFYIEVHNYKDSRERFSKEKIISFANKNEIIGYKNLISTQDLINKGFVKKNKIKIKFGLRPSTYKDQSDLLLTVGKDERVRSALRKSRTMSFFAPRARLESQEDDGSRESKKYVNIDSEDEKDPFEEEESLIEKNTSNFFNEDSYMMNTFLLPSRSQRNSNKISNLNSGYVYPSNELRFTSNILESVNYTVYPENKFNFKKNI